MSVFIILLLVGTAIATGILGGAVVYLVVRASFQRQQHTELTDLEARAHQRQTEIENQAKERVLEAKEEAVRIRTRADEEARETRGPAQQAQRRPHPKEGNPERPGGAVRRRQQAVTAKEQGPGRG